MKAKNLFLQSLIFCLLSACAGTAPTSSTIPAPSIAPTRASTSTTSTVAATVTTGSTVAVQPTESTAELVWNSTGDPNRFDTPDGLGLDPQGNLYVADSRNSRIQKIDGEGH